MRRLTAVGLMGVGMVATALGFEHVLMRGAARPRRRLACMHTWVYEGIEGTVLQYSIYLSTWTGLDWFCTGSDWNELDERTGEVMGLCIPKMIACIV
ncbi:hypothetical protein DL98DRAFT_261758 [Cadophora sp. DSE1049]|nr:hypothetical protein DL98DRAFT_261758 [Cadophora sp. DSE1049]